jgi:carbonic anhydrase/acetyltransferase-like protein (isoleucine patch superfamily)
MIESFVYTLGSTVPCGPEGDGEAWIAPTAVVIGNVLLGHDVSIWFGAVLRGDDDRIEIGQGSNVQDNAVLHVDPGHSILIGRECTIGHRAVVHGCCIGDGTLIGMGAIVLNGARIGKGCLIGAGALVTEGKHIPDHSMVLGAPGKVVREVDAETRAGLVAGAASYRTRWRRYRDEMAIQRIQPCGTMVRDRAQTISCWKSSCLDIAPVP